MDITDFTVADSLIVALIGILVVFAVLLIIIVFLWAQSKVITALDRRKEDKNKPVVGTAEVAEKTADNTELTAVISACIYAMLEEDGEENSDTEFVIRKIEKIKRSGL